ncbi:MAG: D-alanyl-D-alanine carboxypeptidase/D-alanyl-D-alanine-endopeptidase [Balneolales bacterium]|nr:D-alanyl-D-alanine carboxypeptidase/D-alanyl-D-alanine-endopeptidase [Balneolales bacterium]
MATFLQHLPQIKRLTVVALAGIMCVTSITSLAHAQFRNPNEVDTTPAGTAQQAQTADYATAYRTDLIRKIMPHLNHPGFENAWWGIHVRDLNTGATVFSRNGLKGFMPASNTKLYTTSAGLDLFGEDFTFKTNVWKMGEVENGVFRGNLIVEGSGDPTIGGRFNDGDRMEVFRTWAETLKEMGITRIEGDIIGDDSLFDNVNLGRSWSWDYLSYWYAAEMGALSFNDNTIDVEMVGREPGTPSELTWEPYQTDYVQVINETRSIHADSSRRVGYDRPSGTNTITITNLVPQGDTVRYSPSITNPALYFVHVMREEFERQGITVEGNLHDRTGLPKVEGYRTNATKVATHESPTLGEIVYILNQRSQNFYAENLLKTIGAYYKMALAEIPEIDALIGHTPRLFTNTSHSPLINGESVEASGRDGHNAAWLVFGAAGVDTTRLRLADGSGLSRMNVVTPTMTTSLLNFMWHHPDEGIRTAFIESLPKPGEQIGTLTFMFREGAARESVQAKTGTIGMARALSGYIQAADGTPLAFSIMVNHHTVSNNIANRVIENVLNAIAEHPED